MGENVCKLGKRLIFTVRYEELLHLKIKWLITKKMGKGFSQRSSINGSKAHEEEFNINSYSAVLQKLNTSYHARALSRVQVFVTPWTAACWAPLSMGFPGEESWRGLPFPSPGDLPDPGPEAVSLVFPAVAGRFFTTTPPGKPPQVTTWPSNFTDRYMPKGTANLRPEKRAHECSQQLTSRNVAGVHQLINGPKMWMECYFQ